MGIELILALVSILLVILVFYLASLVYHYKTKYEELQHSVDKLREEIRNQLEESIRREYEVKFQRWLAEYEEKIRKDAIERSIAVILGRVGEQLALLIIFTSLGVDPRDLRFLGSPVDYIAFKGLSSGNPQEILFIEVKYGKTTSLTEKQRAIKRLVEERKVRWITLNLREKLEKLAKKILEESSETYETSRRQGTRTRHVYYFEKL